MSEDFKTKEEELTQAGEPTEEELASMTEEERKAFEDAGEDENAEEGQTAEEGGSESAAVEEGVKEEDEKEEVAEPKVPASQPPFVPNFQAEKTDDLQKKLDELDRKLEEGDLDIIQYNRQRDPLIQQRIEAELTEKFNRQSTEQLWKHEQNLFFRANPGYRTDPVLNGALQSTFKALDTPENAGKTGYELLMEAMEAVEARIATLSGGKTPTHKEEKVDIPKKQGSELDRAEIPKTLAGVTAAAENDTPRDEFAYLENLKGVDYEKALAKLTPDQQDRYLRG